MLNTRNVVAVAVIITVVSLIGGLLELLHAPGGLGIDTYGTLDHGYRGLYELLAELHVPVERDNAPPNRLLNRDMTLALIEPSPEIVSTEPTYLNAVGNWIHAGGAVVVSPSARQLQSFGSNIPPKDVLSELGLQGVKVESVGPESDWRLHGDESRSDRSLGEEARRVVKQEAKVIGRKPRLPSGAIVHVTAEGALASVFPHGLNLMLPEFDRRVIESAVGPARSPGKDAKTKRSTEPKKPISFPESSIKVRARAQKPSQAASLGSLPEGRICAILEPDGKPETLAAVYVVGSGTITVLADPRLAQNGLIGDADNSVLVAHLLADPKKPVVFDEFYHGLTVRANPLWLLSRFPYDILAASVLAATLLIGWHASRFLGPPLLPRPASRRTLSEYIEAMARLLNRSRRPVPFLLTEIRQGLLWRLRHDMGLPPGQEDATKIVWILERRDPALAEKAREAILAIDDSLAHPNQPAKDLARTLAKVSVCVPRHAV
jgi:hypothetical protein